MIISHQKTFIQKLISKISFPINVVWKRLHGWVLTALNRGKEVKAGIVF